MIIKTFKLPSIIQLTAGLMHKDRATENHGDTEALYSGVSH